MDLSWKDMDPLLALEDFKKRVQNYEKAYETIGEHEEEVENLQYCKVSSLRFHSLSVR
jgi:6-phosphofructo-2-kinase